ncbi:hypothetical protein HQN87_08265 [Paenibacillus tritici]|uniref:Uncharacterized protein n=1 Tax=Paenibacillus tritici TaxID=1873425 RepID=A0ABX2DL19_9BACL|nr:hypothetical protein [Paenibacillus tritici]NQX45324.1 hypothetical protein [Paenibacillus tritici]
MNNDIDPWEMDSLWLMMEYKRLVILESNGETNADAPYDADQLEEVISHRLREYAIDR